MRPVEVLEDQRAQRLHQIGHGVGARRDLHRPGEHVARHEVRRQKQQREEDEPTGLGRRRAARLERDELHEAGVDDAPARRQRDEQDEAQRSAGDRDAERQREQEDQRGDQHALGALGDQPAEDDRPARDGRRAQLVEVAALDLLDEEQRRGAERGRE